ncbi:MAG: hypothetical protein JXB25_00345 [Deltaproteobacteria bacterium]|nr:hypothetical protein [Deltaproteobacteria bacterium]
MARLSSVPRLAWGAAWLLLFFALASSAHAHRVMIFAWVEGDTIHTASKFSNGKRVQGGEVVVLDRQGKVLVTGKSDQQGAFSFPLPARDDLRLVLNAGMGHRAEWILAADELAAAAEPSAPPVAATPATKPEPAPATAAPPPPVIPPEELERIVDAALERRLQPIRHALAELREEKVGFREVMGGLGYIFGLMGIAAYVRFGKK